MIKRFIKQPNDWTCAAACVCMLTDTPLDQFYAYTGHDGSGNVDISDKWPIGRQCFSIKELFAYLVSHNIILGSAAIFNDGLSIDEEEVDRLEVYHKFTDQAALLSVESETKGMIHMVLWDKENVVDPYCPEEKRRLVDYKTLEWWPIVVLTQ